jgi:hypothetical protein
LSFALDEVRYKRTDIEAELRLAFHGHIREIGEQLPGLQEDPLRGVQHITPWAMDIVSSLLMLIPRYKHEKFHAEKEWRLVRQLPTVQRPPFLNVEYRLSGSLIVPYVAIPLHPTLSDKEVLQRRAQVTSPISEVLIGPSPHREELRAAVNGMAARYGLSRARVRSSDIPFRNW